jgi:predicted Zn-dependent peptidase
LTRNEFYFGRQVTMEEVIELIEAVGREEIRLLAGKMFRPEALTIAALGPVTEEDLGG